MGRYQDDYDDSEISEDNYYGGRNKEKDPLAYSRASNSFAASKAQQQQQQQQQQNRGRSKSQSRTPNSDSRNDVEQGSPRGRSQSRGRAGFATRGRSKSRAKEESTKASGGSGLRMRSLSKSKIGGNKRNGRSKSAERRGGGDNGEVEYEFDEYERANNDRSSPRSSPRQSQQQVRPRSGSAPRNNMGGKKKGGRDKRGGGGGGGGGAYDDLEDEVFSEWSDELSGPLNRREDTFEEDDGYGRDDDGDGYDRRGAMHDDDDDDYEEDDPTYDEEEDDATFIGAPKGLQGLAADGGPADDQGDDEASTHAGKTKFTNVTITPFLPSNLSLGTTVGPDLYSDVKAIASWDWRFIMTQVLSGLSVALTQIPESISYAYIAGIDPFHALQAMWIANVLTPIIGGRPGLFCGPSGLGAIALRFVVSNYGAEYIFYAVILSGFCQVLFGALRIGKYLRLLPPGITIGVVNAMCAMILCLQLRYFKTFPGDVESSLVAAASAEEATVIAAASSFTTDMEPTRHLVEEAVTLATVSEDGLDQPWAYYYGYDLPWDTSTSQLLIVCLEALIAMLICFGLPRLTSMVPSTFVAIVLMTAVNAGFKGLTDWDAPTVGDYCTSELPTSRFWKGIFHSSYTLPSLLEFNTLMAVIPAGLALFCISLLETMVAMNVTDKYTSTDSEQDRVFYGQGVANLAGGLMAGMGVSGLSHTSLHGLRMGGVSSMSVFFAGIYMFMVITFAYPAIAVIPLGATMGVTLYFVWSMIQWTPLAALILKIAPDKALRIKPSLWRQRLSTPDVSSTFATSLFTLFASTYALAGYLAGVICYACDPIAHAIISGDNSKGYAFIELKLSKPPTPRQTAPKEKKVRKWKKKNKADKSETEEDYNEDYEEGVATVEDEDADIENQY